MEGGGSHFSPLTATSVLTAHISRESRGLLGQGLHDAGYFHPDVLCHHRPGHSVLHYLSALVACSCGRSPPKNSSGGRMKRTWPSILLADAPVDFCFCSWSPVQQEASYQQQLPCRPADLFQSLPDMVNPCKARGFFSSEAEALSWDIRNSWAWLADTACV